MRFPEMFVVLASVVLKDLVISAAERPSFRILAPEFVCGPTKSTNLSDETGSAVAVPQQITIGLQTKGGQRLHYDVTVHFELLNGIVSQRHTLLLWKSVRQLEKRFKAEREAISDGNQITIPNEDLVPGVGYTFNVVAVDQAGARSQDQNFTVTYTGKNARAALMQDGSSSAGDVSLLLLGSEVTYPDVPFTVTAKVIFCRPRNAYKFHWTVQGLDEASGVSNTNSDILEIPAGNLSPGKTYNIAVTVVDSAAGNSIVAATMKLSVLKRDLKGGVFPTDATAGFAQTIVIRTLFNDRQISNENWKCEDSTGDGGCSEDLLISKNSATISFLKESMYKVSAAVGDVRLESHIQVNSKSTVSVVLQSLPPLYLLLGQRYEIPVDVSGLFPKCTSNWTVVQQDGFAYLDPSTVGGLGGVQINDIEENFLSELVDYGNDTVTREVSLIIPATAPKWDGLAPDASYKFRLVTTCPEPIDDSVDTKAPRGTVTSHWDMILETNAPPKGLSLEVSPIENGTALSTFFTFSTGVAKERESDYPLVYSYWYSVEGNSIGFASYYEVMSAETQLPYTKSGVSTFYEVCDSRNACSRIDGPKVILLPNPNLNQADLDHRVDAIENSFRRCNIIEATKIAFDAVVTLKNQDSEHFSDFYNKVMLLMETKTPEVQKDFVEWSRYLSASTVLQYAKQVKVLVDFGNHGSQLLGPLLELIDAVEHGPARESREVHLAPSANTAEVKLDLYESQILSANVSEAKQQLLSYIPTATEQFCSNKQRGYSGRLISLDVMRWSAASKSPLQDGVRIPDNASSSVHAILKTSDASIGTSSVSGVAYYCLGKIWFRSDLLTSEPMMGMYQALLVAVDKAGSWKQADWKDGKFTWNASLPAGNHSGSYKCELLTKDLKWYSNLCNSSSDGDSVQCSCSQMSYLRITSKAQVEVSTTATSTTKVVTPPSATATSSTTAIHSAETTPYTDGLTFAPLPTNLTPNTPPTSTSASPSPSTIPSVTSPTVQNTSAVPSPATSQSPTTSTVNTTTTTIQSPTNATTIQQADHLHQSNITRSAAVGGSGAGPLEYSIIGALVLCAGLTGTALVLYRRRRHTTSLTEELQDIAARGRSHSLPVRYARFQDEHNMGGDNVSTISDTITI
ncbi:uncharacterized protein LOC109412601 [Aedes albopictus]|uniref:Uncharacterized protein n=1 Tax=Aedes albopictus TaxID=7160 RepID=A0ABM1ZC72_AEDAL